MDGFMTDLIGTSLGRYHILEQLGEGGMAVVYKAYDTRLETDVAVKVIRTDNLPQNAVARALKRFEREAKLLARLTHPNIVKVTDYGEHDGMPYLVMPYLPGGTLKLKMGKAITWQEAVEILLPIAEALDYAHGQNMIHRDIKPSNILLTDRGQPMLTDFGIAKVLDVEETMDLTGTSAALGTPEYMAPEQATAKTVDHRADIYSLGIVLYEMVTGRKPYKADTPMAVLFKHASEPLPRPKSIVSDLPAQIEKILIKSLEKKPENRFKNMREMIVALKGLKLEKKKKGSHIFGKQKLDDRDSERNDRTSPAPISRLSRPFYVWGFIGGFILILTGILASGQISLLLKKNTIVPISEIIKANPTATQFTVTKIKTPIYVISPTPTLLPVTKTKTPIYVISPTPISTGGTRINLAENKKTSGSPACTANENSTKAVNGSWTQGLSDKWCSYYSASMWWQVDLGEVYNIDEIVVYHAGAGGENKEWNTRDFNIQVSADGVNWTNPVQVKNNTSNITRHKINITPVRYVRLNITNPELGSNQTAARIYEVMVFGP